jgi:ribonuclease BN (tRNA processing enzyme)
MVHEVYSAVQFAHLPPGWKAYHSRFHTSSYELGDVATQGRPKLLVLSHQLFWGATDSSLVEEVRSHFAGRVVSARDLGVY